MAATNAAPEGDMYADPQVLHHHNQRVKELLQQSLAQNAQQNTAVTMLQKEKEGLDRQILVLQQKIATLPSTDDLQAVQDQFGEAQGLLAEYRLKEKEFKGYRDECLELRREISHIKAHHEAQLQELRLHSQTQEVQYQQRITQLTGLVEELEKKGSEAGLIQALRNENQVLSDQAKVLKVEVEEVRDASERKLKDNIDTMRKQAARISELEHITKTAQSDLTRLKETNSKLQAQRDTDELTFEKIHHEKLTLEKDAAHLRQQLDNINSHFATERTALRMTSREREMESQREFQALSDKYVESEKRASQLATAKQQALMDMNDLERKYAVRINQLKEDLEDEKREMEQQHVEAKREKDEIIRSLQLKIETLHANVDVANQHCKLIKGEKEDVQLIHESLESKIQKMEDQMSWLSDERDQALNEVATAISTNDELRQKLQDTLDTQESIDHLKLQYEYLQKDYVHLDAEKEQITTAMAKQVTAVQRDSEIVRAQLTAENEEQRKSLKKLHKLYKKQQLEFAKTLSKVEDKHTGALKDKTRLLRNNNNLKLKQKELSVALDKVQDDNKRLEQYTHQLREDRQQLQSKVMCIPGCDGGGSPTSTSIPVGNTDDLLEKMLESARRAQSLRAKTNSFADLMASLSY